MCDVDFRFSIENFRELNKKLNSKHYFPLLSSQSGIAGALASLTLGESSVEQIAYENQFRKANWEAGQIDYLGR